MKCELRMPPDFKEYPGDPIASNLERSIDLEIATSIKGKPLFSRYSAWHFNGIIWWEDKLGYWCGEVWVYKEYVASYLAETLDELTGEMNAEHGQGE